MPGAGPVRRTGLAPASATLAAPATVTALAASTPVMVRPAGARPRIP